MLAYYTKLNFEVIYFELLNIEIQAHLQFSKYLVIYKIKFKITLLVSCVASLPLLLGVLFIPRKLYCEYILYSFLVQHFTIKGFYIFKHFL